MGEANEGRSRELMENLSLEKYPRDLLQRFMRTNPQSSQSAAFGGGEEEEDSEDLELNLGLSLGGRFGVDKSKNKKLIRSSSVVGTMPIARDSDDSLALVPPVSYPALVRTSSLPTETEEEWRKRKKLQTLRRMAAKRRRSEKQGHFGRAEREEDERDKQQLFASLRAPIGGGGVDLMVKKRQPTSQCCVESRSGSSSGMSEFESKLVQGSSTYGEARSPAGHQSLQERSQEIMGPSGAQSSAENKCSTSGSKTENPSKKPNSGGNKGREIGMNAMEDMPCVFTKGDGPNGRRIDGILYRYGKGEDVRIVCICHGKFLSPAEFIKHAGGGDVDHPLRHIVINPSSTSFLL